MSRTKNWRKPAAMEQRAADTAAQFLVPDPSGDNMIARRDLAEPDDRAIARTARLYTALARIAGAPPM